MEFAETPMLLLELFVEMNPETFVLHDVEKIH